VQSVVQALSSLQPFLHLLFALEKMTVFALSRRNDLTHHSKERQSIMKCTQVLFAQLLLSQRRSIAPREFSDLVRPQWFSPGTQQDAYEYLLFVTFE
jgi:ubiquitin C-terminal hydrolase